MKKRKRQAFPREETLRLRLRNGPEKRILALRTPRNGETHIDATCARAGMFIPARAKFRLREINIIVPVGLNLHLPAHRGRRIMRAYARTDIWRICKRTNIFEHRTMMRSIYRGRPIYFITIICKYRQINFNFIKPALQFFIELLLFFINYYLIFFINYYFYRIFYKYYL